MMYLTDRQASVVHAWWRGLQPQDGTGAPGSGSIEADTQDRARPCWFDRGHRARLRRAASLEQMQAESACFELRQRMGELTRSPWLDQNDGEWLLLLCGAVAHVNKDTYDDRSLPMALGRSSALNDVNAMSEMRFRRLLKEEDVESFYRQLRRALQLASGPINVAQFANDLIAWCAERRSRLNRPDDSMRYRWARDYFLARKDLRPADQDITAVTAN